MSRKHVEVEVIGGPLKLGAESYRVGNRFKLPPKQASEYAGYGWVSIVGEIVEQKPGEPVKLVVTDSIQYLAAD